MASASSEININVGLYDPFSIFQGGFRSDFEKHVNIPSFYWKDNYDCMKVLKNLHFSFKEEIPHAEYKDLKYLKFMFVACQSVDDYRAKVRPLILQWLSGMKSQKPKLPYFIIFFENSELKTTTDKYLKTNIFNKLKVDFDNKEFGVENIFKIKSIYPINEDRIEAWKLITTSIKSLLSHSINTQLTFHSEDMSKIASIYQDLSQYDGALTCYSKLFNKHHSLGKSEFSKFSFNDLIKEVQNDEFSVSETETTHFAWKLYYYYKQRDVLLNESYTDLVFIKNLCRLAQTLLAFLNSLEICYERNEISFILVNEFMDNERMWKIITIENRGIDVLTYIGKLKLLQRNDLIALGTSKKYYIKGSMTLVDVHFDIDNYEIKNEQLTEIFSAKKKFIDYVVEMTRDLISIYDKSSVNTNTLATLSTELALILFYSTEDYETSCDQLSKSYKFFYENRWKYIGLSLLEIYIENLDKLVANNGQDVVFQLLTSYITLVVNKTSKFDEDKFRSLCSQLPKKSILKIEQLFRINEVSNIYCDESDIYKVKLQIHSKLNCKIDKIRLIMRNANNNIVEFMGDDVVFGEASEIILCCSKIWYGDFKATNMILAIDNFEISQTVSFKFHIVPIDTYIDKISDKISYNTTSTIRIPKLRYLNSDKLLFEVIVGSNSISNVEFVFIKTDPDKLNPVSTYEMKSYKNEKYEVIEIIVSETEKSISFKPKSHVVFTPGTIVFVEIPYYFPPDVSNTILDLHYAFNFNSMKENEINFPCSFKYFSQIESLLPVAVAADEIIKSIKRQDDTSETLSFSIFSHFTINSISIEQPVRIQNVELVSSGCKIETWKSPKNIIAFMDQGTTFFYKVTNFGNDNVLLKIKYNTIKDEIINFMNMAFIKFLEEKSPTMLRDVNFLSLKSIIVDIWKSFEFKLNTYALSGKVFILNKDDVDIKQFLKYLDAKHRELYFSEITEFINSLKTLEVGEDFKSRLYVSVQQELDITVYLPELNIINVVEYQFDQALQYLVCEPIDVEINLDVHLLKFSASQIEEFDTLAKNEKKVRFQSTDERKSVETRAGDAEIELCFTDYDQKWIISGLKNLQAKVNLKELLQSKCLKYKFKLTLVPLKVGKLTLPSIEVKNKNNLRIAMELDYKNVSESILVVSELNKIIHSF